MKKFGKDPTVKKTLLRNYEKPVTKDNNLAAFDSLPSSSKTSYRKTTHEKDWNLDQPTLCSSEMLENYLYHTKNNLPPPHKQDLEKDKDELCTQITKKLNFHFNDRIYKNLVELNTSVEKPLKINKRPSKTKITPKRDLEPNIEDFCNVEKVSDVLPDIQILKPKINRVRPIENGELHKLVASFESL